MIGKVIAEIADFFLIYSQYFANQPVANKTIMGLRNNSQFDAFLDVSPPDNRCLDRILT